MQQIPLVPELAAQPLERSKHVDTADAATSRAPSHSQPNMKTVCRACSLANGRRGPRPLVRTYGTLTATPQKRNSGHSTLLNASAKLILVRPCAFSLLRWACRVFTGWSRPFVDPASSLSGCSCGWGGGPWGSAVASPAGSGSPSSGPAGLWPSPGTGRRRGSPLASACRQRQTQQNDCTPIIDSRGRRMQSQKTSPALARASQIRFRCSGRYTAVHTCSDAFLRTTRESKAEAQAVCCGPQ